MPERPEFDPSWEPVLRRMASGQKLNVEEQAIYAEYVERQRLRGESDFNRWSSDLVFAPQWDERTAALREMIPEFVTSVVDFGCGVMALRAMLPPEIRYVPLDIVPRSPDTVVVDLNAPHLPALPHADLAFFSGLLEYVIDLNRLLDAVADRYPVVVCSYVVANNDPDQVQSRRCGGWVTDLKLSELAARFENRDYILQKMNLFGIHSLFLFTQSTLLKS